MKRAAVIFAAVLAACFGAGPLPSPATEATIVFAIGPSMTDDTRCTSYYIGDVALGSDAGYTVLIPFNPHRCNGGGVTPQGMPQPVFRFTKTGDSTMIGSAGPSSQNGEPQVAAFGSGSWAYPDPGAQNSIRIDPDGPSIPFTQPPGSSTFIAAALVSASDGLYLAAAPSTGAVPANDPTYPAINTMGMQGGGTTGALQSVTGTVTISAPVLGCSQTSHCVAVTSDTVYYFDQPVGSMAGTAAVRAAPKTTNATPTKIADIGLTGGITSPVGLAADDTTVVWAASISYANPSSNAIPTGCAVSKYQAGTATTVFTTSKFSCHDLALDGTHAYFTIVSVSGDDTNNLTMRGDGVARVDLATGTVESLALGFLTPASGPRRVLVDATDLYLVDPVVIGKIAKTALDGRHDFEP